MLVQTCTKEKPTSVLQHLAGKWWNFTPVPPIVYTSFTLVSNVFCPVFAAPCLSLFIVLATALALPSYPLFLNSHVA
jgi:hypothetical protein